MDLKMLNKTSSLTELKPQIKIRELPIDVPFVILEAKIVKGKFGDSVLLELEDKVVFLPSRVTDCFKKNLEKFQSNKYTITFKGEEQVGSYQPAAKFEINEA